MNPIVMPVRDTKLDTEIDLEHVKSINIVWNVVLYVEHKKTWLLKENMWLFENFHVEGD